MKSAVTISLNGCHNRLPMKKTYEAQDGYIRDSNVLDGEEITLAIPISVTITHNMSTDCQHDSYADPKCKGCCHKRKRSKPVEDKYLKGKTK